MAANSPRETAERVAARKPWLNRGTILVLCGITFGITAAHSLPPLVEIWALCTAFVGLLWHTARTDVAKEQQLKCSQRQLEQAAIELERRFARHAQREVGSDLRLHGMHEQPHEQFLTVVKSLSVAAR